MKDMFIKISLWLGGCLTQRKSCKSGHTMRHKGGGTERDLRSREALTRNLFFWLNEEQFNAQFLYFM